MDRIKPIVWLIVLVLALLRCLHSEMRAEAAAQSQIKATKPGSATVSGRVTDRQFKWNTDFTEVTDSYGS